MLLPRTWLLGLHALSANYHRNNHHAVWMTADHPTVSPPSSIIPPPMVVVFGPPGAGKTTIAQAALEVWQSDDTSLLLGLDLDVCVPEWMKDNFAQGIYPTLSQRQEFAKDCCDHVQKAFHHAQEESETDTTPKAAAAAIVSFSFVNTDLRDVFRERFPQAHWVLVDVTDEEATRRIQQRENHFYKGAQQNAVGGSKDDSEGINPGGLEVDSARENDAEENSEWNFAPVTFEHTILDGTLPVKENAQRVAHILQTILPNLPL